MYCATVFSDFVFFLQNTVQDPFQYTPTDIIMVVCLNPTSLQDPTLVLNEYGADALRLYLINSPVVRGETLRFKKEGVFAVVKDVFLPWYNAYRFLVQNVLRLQQQSGITFEPTKVPVPPHYNHISSCCVRQCTTVCELLHTLCLMHDECLA